MVARAADGDETVAVSNPYRHRAATATVRDFSSGAGTTRFGFGRQTTSWSSVGTSLNPVTTALTALEYAALATSNATGGTSDANRYISPAISSGSEATHLFRFTIDEPLASIDEIVVTWEGFAERCTQAELYVWNRTLSQWGDATGLVGQNRYLDNYAGNRDRTLVGRLRTNLGSFVGPDGSIRFLVYAERPADRTFHDYLSLTVLQAETCAADIDGSGSVDAGDLALVLAGWGACAGCPADLDGSGTVDASDLALTLAGWGGCP